MIRNLLLIILFSGYSGIAISQDKYIQEPDWFKTYDVKFYSIDLDIRDTSTFIKGNTLIKIEIKENTDTIVLNFNPNLTIDSVFVGNQKIKSFKYLSDLLVLKQNVSYQKGTILDLIVFYQGNVNTNAFFSSLSSEQDNYWNIPVTWTLSEPFGAKHWFPCKQQLTDKADSCWVYLTVPKGRKAGSLGLLADTMVIADNKVQYQWKSRYPVAYYLISFSVADYKDYSFYFKPAGRNDSLLIQNYLYNRPGYIESNKSEIDKTGQFLDLYSKLFGLYPFYSEKYGHCVAPIGGGMEHQTMTTLVNFGYSLVAHELAHQWFGNSITCATWQDIWINEGFASYCEYLAYEFLESKSEANSWMENAQNRALRETEGSVFIPKSSADDEYRIFSSNLSYKKGAVILHMLRHEINDDSLFFKSIRAYLDKYRYGNATGDDFKIVMEEQTGLDFNSFFNQWYYGKGYPQFDLSWKTSDDSLFLNVQQTASSNSISFFKTPFDLQLSLNNRDTTIRLYQTTNPETFKIKLSGTVSNVIFDPANWLLKKVDNINKLPEIPSNDDFFMVKPNPFNEDLYIIFKSDPAKDTKIKIVGLSGTVLFESSVRRRKEIMLNTAAFGPGIYLVVVTHGQEKYVRKIVKANTN